MKISRISALRFHTTVFTTLLSLILFLPACAQSRLLSWQDTSNNETGFRIYRIAGGTKQLIGEVPANVTHYTDDDAPRDACYFVTAFNAVGESSPSNTNCGPATQTVKR